MNAQPLIVDAGAFLSSVNVDDPDHHRVQTILWGDTRPRVTSQLVVAEVDYMLLTRGGVGSEVAFLDDIISGAYRAECLTVDELIVARELITRYRDLEIGLADASLVVLCRRFRTRTIVTLDERCFRAMQPLDGGHFEPLPADG